MSFQRNAAFIYGVNIPGSLPKKGLFQFVERFARFVEKLPKKPVIGGEN